MRCQQVVSTARSIRKSAASSLILEKAVAVDGATSSAGGMALGRVGSRAVEVRQIQVSDTLAGWGGEMGNVWVDGGQCAELMGEVVAVFLLVGICIAGAGILINE